MTYGEYHYLVKYDMKLINGTWVAKKPHNTIPSKMTKEDASVYYTQKLNKYWENNTEKKEPV